jgi:hypothetical protein
LHFNNAKSIPCAGLTISHFAGDAAAVVDGGATVTLVECTFIENSITGFYSNSAALSVNNIGPHRDALLQDTIVRLENCTFTRNVADNLLLARVGGEESSPLASAHIYSDNTTQMVVWVNGSNEIVGHAEPLTALPASRQGINGTSEWFQRVQKVISPCFISVHKPR